MDLELVCLICGPGTSAEAIAITAVVTSYTINVGGGGNQGNGIIADAGYGTQGSPSSIVGPNITTITSTGGGAGANLDSTPNNGGGGGSGGGAAHLNPRTLVKQEEIASSPVQGYAGGNHPVPYASPFFGAGGGGAGGAGGECFTWFMGKWW